MTILKHAAVIERPLPEIYGLCQQVERYPEFLPGYCESKIIAQNGERYLLERAAHVQGHLYRWQSWVWFEANQAIYFEQAEGPLRGMRVTWRFDALSSDRTKVEITHRFHLARPWGSGFFAERFVFKPKIDAIATLVIAALKKVCESKKPEVMHV